MLAGFLGNHVNIPIVGIGVSRDPADQDPLVHKDAQAVADLLGLEMTVPRTEAILLDPVYTGKIMAGLIGLARKGHFAKTENVLFIHTGGAPSLHAYEAEVLGLKALPG
ncbi:MAG: hypothetical protein V4646_18850 [Pseudomonadota bacterium]